METVSEDITETPSAAYLCDILQSVLKPFHDRMLRKSLTVNLIVDPPLNSRLCVPTETIRRKVAALINDALDETNMGAIIIHAEEISVNKMQISVVDTRHLSKADGQGVCATSAPGLTQSIVLPYKTAFASFENVASMRSRNHVWFSGAKILIVDSCSASREPLCSLYRDMDAVVFEAESEKEAVSLCADHRFDLILTELELPGGDEAIASIRNQNDHHIETPIFIVSAEFSALEAGQTGNGPYSLVAKPINFERLTEMSIKAFKSQQNPCGNDRSFAA